MFRGFMSGKIIVVDYGMGNLRSVSKALEHLGGKVMVSSSPSDIEMAEKIVLPGVGAFGDAAAELKRQNLMEPLRQAVEKKKPFFGICLGLQLLFKTSEESPEGEGLNVLPGKVQLFRSKNIKIPQMGWNQVVWQKSHPLIKNVPSNSYFYFVHSYYAAPEKKEAALGQTTYGEETFTSVVAHENIFATQFHPEKSQKAGLEILKNFINV